MTPTVVTTTSEPVVTVVGTVANVGDRPVRDVMVRLEHAAAVASSAGLRTNLDGANDQFRPVDTFVTISEELQRGQEIGFTLSTPVRAVDQPSLEIDRPGVYPVLVNVNGTPDYGEPARLDDARFLLPVLGVPANPDEPAASLPALSAAACKALMTSGSVGGGPTCAVALGEVEAAAEVGAGCPAARAISVASACAWSDRWAATVVSAEASEGSAAAAAAVASWLSWRASSSCASRSSTSGSGVELHAETATPNRANATPPTST
ncbi:hypothetical protein C1Y40_02648 [Mycobacterium talmoniae]|uniref:Uncharacterized protein n=1 Tax=Mycobacterium talmoniae TaxID=1858794 RepID=A0A2S8BKF8_9MYCO|nr:hypothetical protein C1Y40_02648 [Mycobacterium talmoniae]